MNHRIVARFADADHLLAALARLSREGHSDIVTYTPVDLPQVDEILHPPPTRLPALAFAGGAVGLLIGFGVQWWADVHSYPLDIGGRPAHPIPAFVPSAFEATIAASALAIVAGWLLLLRLPRLWAPIDEVDGFPRVSVDEYWLAMNVPSQDADREQVTASLRHDGAIAVTFEAAT